MNKSFKKVARIQEASKIIHGFWSKENIFVYSTYNHLKYVLPNGDGGILRSVRDIRYPVAWTDAGIHAFDGDNLLAKFDANKEECLFKLALWQNDIQAVKGFVKSTKKTDASAMVAYLQKKNYPAVALSMAADTSCKFQLALKSGNLQAAYESATVMKDPACFEKLAQEALVQGCHPVLSDDSAGRDRLPGKQEHSTAKLLTSGHRQHEGSRSDQGDRQERRGCHDSIQRVVVSR